MPWVSRRVNGSSRAAPGPRRASACGRSASTAGAGWRARCRRRTGPPASSSRPRRVQHRACRLSGAGVARVVPGRLHESVEGVGFPGGCHVRSRAAWSCVERGHFLERRPTPSNLHVGGQEHRQAVRGHGDLGAASAQIDTSGSARPSSAGAIRPSRAGGSSAVRATLALRVPGASAIASKACSKSRPSNSPELTSTSLLGERGLSRGRRAWPDPAAAITCIDRQPVGAREFPVALVVARYATSPRRSRSPSARSWRPRSAPRAR